MKKENETTRASSKVPSKQTLNGDKAAENGKVEEKSKKENGNNKATAKG